MEGGKAPGFIFDPSPAPRAHPNPVAKAIGRPSRNHGARTPAGAVASDVAPVAVRIKVFVSGHFARNVVGGIGAIFALIAVEGPAIKIIATGNLAKIVIQMIGTGEGGALPGDDGVGETAARNLAASVPYGQFSSIAIGIHIDAELAGLEHGEGDVGRVDLISIFVVYMQDADDQRTLRQANLSGVVTDLKQCDPSLGTQAECS